MSDVSMLEQLRAPFPKNKHLSNYNGWIYVDETAVSERLDEVDPNWEFQIISISNRDRQISVHARLTILGVSRDGIGMNIIEYVKEKDDKGNVLGETDIEVSEPEKAAATDALRRCARLFGIGRYLLNGAPKAKGSKGWEAGGVWTGFNKWYDQQFSPVEPAKRPAPAKQQDDQRVETGEDNSELILVQEVRFTKIKGKDFLNLIADNGAFYRLTTTKPFADAGYKPKEWFEAGGAKFDPMLTVYVVKNGDVYDVTHVGGIPF